MPRRKAPAVSYVADSQRSFGPSKPLARNTAEVVAALPPLAFESEVERFWVMALNARNEVMGVECVAVGGYSLCAVDPRVVFHTVLTKWPKAGGLVVFHNHPSGDTSPSAQDVALTRQLNDGAKLLCFQLLDHVVVAADRSFTSLQAAGLMPSGRTY